MLKAVQFVQFVITCYLLYCFCYCHLFSLLFFDNSLETVLHSNDIMLMLTNNEINYYYYCTTGILVSRPLQPGLSQSSSITWIHFKEHF